MSRITIGNVKGPAGKSATISIGEVSSGAAGSEVSVVNSGTETDAVLDFTIPGNEGINLPVMYLSGGNPGNMTGDVEETFAVKYVEPGRTIECYAAVSWQGSSSLAYPKKNYKIKLFKDIKLSDKNKLRLRPTWTRANRYNLKANWIDVTHSRNVVCGNIVANVLKSNSAIPEQLYTSPNFGQVDGFPILLYIDGTLQGLYTFNLGKKDEMLGLDDEKTQVCFEGEAWGDAVRFQADTAKIDGSDWELTYPDDLTESHRSKLNELLTFVHSADDNTFADGIEKRVNVPMLIDYIILVQVFNASDNMGKNMMLVSYDGGTSWVPQLRDLDTVMGLEWNGSALYSDTRDLSNYGNNNLLRRVATLYKNSIRKRYETLRKNELSNWAMVGMFTDFIDAVGEGNYNLDLKLWPDIPSKDITDSQQIVKAIIERCNMLDESFLTADESSRLEGAVLTVGGIDLPSADYPLVETSQSNYNYTLTNKEPGTVYCVQPHDFGGGNVFFLGGTAIDRIKQNGEITYNRNCAQESAFMANTLWKFSQDAGATNVIHGIGGGVIDLYGSNNYWKQYQLYSNQGAGALNNLEYGKEYTLSVEVYFPSESAGTFTLSLRANTSGASINPISSGEINIKNLTPGVWNRVNITGTIPTGIDGLSYWRVILCSNVIGALKFRQPKLESGSASTAWTQSPEDITV